MPQFDISSFSLQFIWLSLTFGVLYLIVSRIIAPKAEEILTYRNRYLEENIAASEEYNYKARSLRELKDAKLKELNIEIEKFHKDSVETLNARFLNKNIELSSSLTQKTQESLSEIQECVNNFYTSKDKACLDLAAFIIEKITNKPADLQLLEKIYKGK